MPKSLQNPINPGALGMLMRPTLCLETDYGYMAEYIKEACVETLQQGINAETQGADRIELCADLAADGLTPSTELIKQAKNHLNIPIRVMIRPRPGDFVYTKEELEVMKASISLCKQLGVDGVVFGVTTINNQLDLSAISYLSSHARPLKVTIHKAIDDCVNPIQELLKLRDLGIDSVLTSGKAPTAREGAQLLEEMVRKAGPIELIACGKVTNENLQEIDQLMSAPAYHGKKIVGHLD